MVKRGQLPVGTDEGSIPLPHALDSSMGNEDPSIASLARVATLEEQVRVKELVLTHLLERKTFLHEQVETTRLQYQRLRERMVLLQERKLHLRAARVKHLTLQRELKESLAKSRERLARLTSLEQLDDHDGSQNGGVDSCDGSEEMSEEWQLTESQKDPTTSNSKNENLGLVIDQKKRPRESVPNTSRMFSVTGAKNQSLDIQHFNQCHCRSRSLMTFLPSIGPRLAGEIITLSIREANALVSSSNPSIRRCLLWNTCLDFGLLIPDGSETNLQSDEIVEDKDSKLEQSLDPNILLCPYELAGVCADEFCPYQHSSRQTLSREQIPLPSLSLQWKPENLSDIPATKSSASSNRKQSATIEPTEEVDSNIAKKPAPITDMDFIALPRSKSEDETTTENSESESEDEDENDDDDDDDNGILLLRKNPSVSKTVRFWWGGRIEHREGSLDQIIQTLQGLTTLDGFSAPQSMAWAVEVSRLAIHGGRFELAKLFELLGNQPDWCRRLLGKLQETVRVSFLYESVPFSFIRVSFQNQAVLSVLSALLSSAEESSTFESSLIEVVMECSSMLTSTHDVTTPSGSIEFTISDFRRILSASQVDWNAAGTTWQDDACAKVIDLQNSLSWVKHVFGPSSPHRKALHHVDNHILQPCWTAVRRYIVLLKPEEATWGAVKATLLMGYIVLSCLEWFAAHVHVDSLTASLTAALRTIDATVSQILKGLAKHFSNVPMMDVLLSPLFAANVTTATFLRLYSVSHNRLESLLALNSNHRTNRPLFLTQFSELLWSQFFHLRMALPIDSGQTATADDQPEETTRSERYSWEPCKDIEKENQILLEKIETMGICLHHITLQGDRILAQALSNHCPPTTPGLPLDSRGAQSLRQMANNVLEWIYSDKYPDGGRNAKEEIWHSIEQKGIPLYNVVDGIHPIRSPEISTFPSSLLLAGRVLQKLSLSDCAMTLLPASFGLYFPNLLSLDLSSNRIDRIPLSFRSMHRLERLDLSQNFLVELLGDELMASLKYLDISHNCLTQLSHSFADTLSSRCSQLEELNLSWNSLDASTAKFLGQVLVPKWTLQIKGLRHVQWTPQNEETCDSDCL